MIRMMPTSRPTHRPPVVGKEPAPFRMVFLGRQRAGDRERRDDHEEAADEHRDRERQRPEGVGCGQAGEGGAVVSRRRRVGVEDLAEAVRALVEQALEPVRIDRGERRAAEDHQRQDRDGEHRQLHLAALDLLADIFGRAPDHQPGDEDRDDREQQEAVEARADAADDDLAELDVEHRHQPADRREAVVHRVDRAARGVGGDGREQGRGGGAEAHLLALHVALRGVDAHRMVDRVAGAFGDVGSGDAARHQEHHRGEDRPALLRIADGLAERPGQARAAARRSTASG